MLRATRTLATCALSLGLLGACTTHGANTYLLVTEAVWPTGTLSGSSTLENCVAPASGVEIMNAAFDPSQHLVLGFVVQNRLQPAPNIPAGQLGNDDFRAEQIVVAYELVSSSGKLPGEVKSWATGTVLTGGTSGVLAEVARVGDFAGAPKGEVVRAHVYITGHLVSGASAQTSDYEFLLEVGGTGSGFVCQP
jgi:hypothetical protein